MMLSLTFKRAVVLALVALVVAGCGRRGALDRPAGPAAEAAAPAQPGSVNTDVPDRPFVLDPLID